MMAQRPGRTRGTADWKTMNQPGFSAGSRDGSPSRRYCFFFLN